MKTRSVPVDFQHFAMLASLLTLGACASTPREPVSETLDPATATTVTVLTAPIELFSQMPRTQGNDPFAYLAPFETDRQGERDLYLWVSTPVTDQAPTAPRILCNGEPLELQPLGNDAAGTPAPGAGAQVNVDLAQINLSRAPYQAPVPWSAQWYFRLPPEALKCLAGAEGVALETRAAGGNDAKFSAERKNLAALDAFTHR